MAASILAPSVSPGGSRSDSSARCRSGMSTPKKPSIREKAESARRSSSRSGSSAATRCAKRAAVEQHARRALVLELALAERQLLIDGVAHQGVHERDRRLAAQDLRAREHPG